MAYYYRDGEQVPVEIAQSAAVARTSDERGAIDIPGWRTVPLAPGLTLVVSPDAVPEGQERGTEDERAVVVEQLMEHELDARRSGESDSERGPAQEEFEGVPEAAFFPVVIDEQSWGALFPSGEVVASFPAGEDREALERFALARGWAIARTLTWMNGYVFRSETSTDPLEFANALVEERGAAVGHPVFLEQIEERSATAVAPAQAAPQEAERADEDVPASFGLFAREWHLHNVGQSGAVRGVDVAAVPAWQVTLGSPDIAICVVDSGVETTHEAFVPERMRPGYDFAEKDSNPAPAGSYHGTACAAVAAAGGPNGQVLGVAPRCSIIPVRRTGLDDHLALAEALVWAADQGADVISCSWGVDGRRWVLPDVVRSAFQYIVTHGRNGRGVPIFWAAGNGNEDISTDEWASSELTIAVAASTDQGRRAPYSDFGVEVDVCAPSSGGVNAITTADNLGYTDRFGGTSSAAPLAAGVAALVLSLAPNLRWTELRDLLRASSRKIDPQNGQYDANGHSPMYGHGQVDAAAALSRIPAFVECARATETEALAADIDEFRDFLSGLAVGSQLIEFCAARRLGILGAVRVSPEFRRSVGFGLRLAADLGGRHSRNEPLELPASAWPEIVTLARTISGIEPDPPLVEGDGRTTRGEEEGPMADERGDQPTAPPVPPQIPLDEFISAVQSGVQRALEQDRAERATRTGEDPGERRFIPPDIIFGLIFRPPSEF